MTSSDFIIREIQPKDNQQIAKVLRSVMLELGMPKKGTAFEDKELDNMFEAYQDKNRIYYVVEYKGEIVGGAGIAKLSNYEGNTCELQKMYFLPVARGKGLGAKMISHCLEKAKNFGFTECYLETMPYMKAAQKLYKKTGFTEISNPIGNTCHSACDVWMIKKL